MLRRSAFLVTIAAAGCTAASTPSGVTRSDLRVTLVADYYWPQAFTPAGSSAEIEVFPLVTALVVERRDGFALDPNDETVSRAAARAHCEAGGKRFGDSGLSRHADGKWAFPPCADS